MARAALILKLRTFFDANEKVALLVRLFATLPKTMMIFNTLLQPRDIPVQLGNKN